MNGFPKAHFIPKDAAYFLFVQTPEPFLHGFEFGFNGKVQRIGVRVTVQRKSKATQLIGLVPLGNVRSN